ILRLRRANSDIQYIIPKRGTPDTRDFRRDAAAKAGGKWCGQRAGGSPVPVVSVCLAEIRRLLRLCPDTAGRDPPWAPNRSSPLPAIAQDRHELGAACFVRRRPAAAAATNRQRPGLRPNRCALF